LHIVRNDCVDYQTEVYEVGNWSYKF